MDKFTCICLSVNEERLDIVLIEPLPWQFTWCGWTWFYWLLLFVKRTEKECKIVKADKGSCYTFLSYYSIVTVFDLVSLLSNIYLWSSSPVINVHVNGLVEQARQHASQLKRSPCSPVKLQLCTQSTWEWSSTNTPLRRRDQKKYINRY